MTTLELMGIMAKKAAALLRNVSSLQKDKALERIASSLIENCDKILAANEIDVKAAKEQGISKALLDRLTLTKERVEAMAKGVSEVAALKDPVGEIVEGFTRPNGLKIQKVRVPLGVIAIIYEARPNVTADAAALCLKSGNAVILRGGKEAINSNLCITKIMRDALEASGLPRDCVAVVEDTSRETANELMRMKKYIDVLIPRGGAGLIRAVTENSTVPVIETGVGNCHVYIEATADIDMAREIVFNAKTSRPSVCNACETLLVHKDIAHKALPAIAERLSEKNVEIRGCRRTMDILKGRSDAAEATEEDYYTEYGDYILAVKVVGSTFEAVEHISKYGSGHSDAIVTKDYNAANYFVSSVDSAAVYVNASTRFTDGGEFGLGAEIGISTQKLHARGPMGLNELTTFKYIVFGTGQVR